MIHSENGHSTWKRRGAPFKGEIMRYLPRTATVLLILPLLLLLIPACSSDDDTPTTPPTPSDTTSPEQITNLSCVVDANSVTLSWTGPTDTKQAKASVAYDLCYTTDETALTEESWAEATPVTGLPEPDPENPQEFTVEDLNWDWVYHFGLKTRDAADNWSLLSNVETVTIPEQTPDETAPAAVTDLVAHSYSPTNEQAIYLTWTAPGDNGDRGTATEYLLKWSTEQLTEQNWGSAPEMTFAVGGPAGANESVQVPELEIETTYYFRLMTGDEVEEPDRNWSDLSNEASQETWPIELIQITSGADSGRQPTWSPDGNELAYRKVDGDFAHIWRIDAWGGQAAVPITTGAVFCSEPSWSVDGDIVYHAKDEFEPYDREVYLFPVENIFPIGLVNLTNNLIWDSEPAWSADGQRIAFSSSGGVLEFKSIWVGDPDLMNWNNITVGDFKDDLPAWSPDGTRIAFQSNRNGHNDLWVAYVTTGDPLLPTSLTDHEDLDTKPTWSPDGQWIAFCSKRSGTDAIWIIPSDGSSAPLQVTDDVDDDFDPEWSPNGRKIAFVTGPEGNEDIWVMRVPYWAWPAE